VLTVEPREFLESSIADDEGGVMVWETPQATYGTFTVLLIALLYFFTGTEIGKYKFLGLAIPLYSKLTKRMVLDHETRGMIRGYIIANPGDHFTSIKKHIGLKNGTLAYHLKILERENIIKSHRDGIFKRFYPINAPVSPDMVHLSKQEMILNKVIENPGISRKDLALAVGLSRQVVNYHSKGLIQAGLIRSEKYGKRIQYYATEPMSS
jgi:predicted transcriptional regulator